jgi:hypothetical protein
MNKDNILGAVFKNRLGSFVAFNCKKYLLKDYERTGWGFYPTYFDKESRELLTCQSPHINRCGQFTDGFIFESVVEDQIKNGELIYVGEVEDLISCTDGVKIAYDG